MKLFGPLYDLTLRWSRHRHAPVLLTALSFVEGFIFPVPPEIMLAPMSLAQPRRALWFATLSLAGSVAGAMVGYLLGHFAFAAVQPLIVSLGWSARIDEQVRHLQAMVVQSPWRVFWFLVLAGFTPIPLKFFTWAAGVVGVPVAPFLASMLVGRGKRVYLMAGAIHLGGVRAAAALYRWIEPLGWMAVAVLAAIMAWLAWTTLNG